MFANHIAKLSLDAYNCLKKTGKPTENEWTVLSTIVSETTDELCVIALGTGTKCIGKSQMSLDGVILNDSHAEVVCRRAFMRYLYNEMLDSKSDIVCIENERFTLTDGIKFHLYSSLMPCGDASIFPKSENDYGSVINSKAHSLTEQDSGEDKLQPDAKKIKLDFHRTGAKCLPSDGNVDKKDFGSEYRITGAVRTKPGRGDPTVSASCSDKIAKWIQVGIQGSLLSMLLEDPIYLSSITIGHEIYCKDALERALYKRFVSIENDCKQHPFKQHIPELFHCSSLKFPAQKCTEKQPAPSSIIYVKNSKVEVAVEGFKQGVTKKNQYTPSGRLQICKLELYRSFLKVSAKLNKKLDCNLTYGALKHSTEYTKHWNDVKEKKFKVWPVKDSSLEEFVTYIQ